MIVVSTLGCGPGRDGSSPSVRTNDLLYININEIHRGVIDMERNDLVEKMKAVLASAFSLYLKAHNYHWNVTGPNFKE